MKRLQPEVIVLRGCGIVNKQVLAIPTLGTINPHYAVLPAYRGMETTNGRCFTVIRARSACIGLPRPWMRAA